MKKALVLATALLLSLSANSYAENSSEAVKERKDRKERQYKGDREGKKMHSRDSEMSDSKKSAAKKQCAQKCNLNKDKVRECRKKHGAKKGESLNGKCVPEKTKSCIRSCMQKHKGKQQDPKQTRNGERKDRNDQSVRQDRRVNKSDSE